jgi:hypothetical protein
VFQVFFERIDLPHIAVGIMDPELGLPGIAAFDPFFPHGADAGEFEPPLHFDESGGIRHAEAQVIERAAGLVFERFQRQHEGRVVQLELGIVGAALGRFRIEEGAEKGNGAVKVGDIQRKMEAHAGLRRLRRLGIARTRRHGNDGSH